MHIRKSVPQGRNVSEIGSELSAGDTLVSAGRRIGPGETALLAAFGVARVPVVRKPRIGVLSTGSELLEVHEELAPARIRNSNSPMLHALLRDVGAEPVMLGKVPDRPDDAEAVIREALQSCDMLITTGGVSVGDHDIMVDILARWEGRTLFNKIAMRPGSPTTAAVLGGKLLLALSAIPARASSASICLPHRSSAPCSDIPSRSLNRYRCDWQNHSPKSTLSPVTCAAAWNFAKERRGRGRPA